MMDAKNQPGIRFLGIDLLQLEFAMTGQIPKRIPAAWLFSVTSQFSEDKKTLDLFVKTDMFGNLPDAEKPPIVLNFLFHARYEVTEGENLSLEEFSRHNAPAYVIPYVRELVANITSRSVLPTLNLAPINIIAMIDAGEAKFEVALADKRSEEV